MNQAVHEPLPYLPSHLIEQDRFLFIRQEIPADIPAIFEVNYQAFAHYDEARLVDALRDAKVFNPELALVAVDGDRIIRHIMFPPVTIESPGVITPAIALAPLVVRPDYQCRGVGTALIEEGLEVCRTLGHRIVIVIGHPGYYPWYGFRSTRSNGIVASFALADDVFMVLALDPDALDGIRGTVRYPEAFDAIEGMSVPESNKVHSIS